MESFTNPAYDKHEDGQDPTGASGPISDDHVVRDGQHPGNRELPDLPQDPTYKPPPQENKYASLKRRRSSRWKYFSVAAVIVVVVAAVAVVVSVYLGVKGNDGNTLLPYII